MTTQEIAEGVLEWAGDLLSIDTGSRYSWPVAEKLGALPDLVAVVTRVRRVLNVPPEDFPQFQLQQIEVFRIYDLELSVQVEDATTEAGAKAAQETLEAAADSMYGSSAADTTLGGKVPATSITMNFDLSDPFQEYADGTKGRFLFATFSVAEPIA